MAAINRGILTINGGSSSIKFAVFEIEGPPVQLLNGEIQRIGSNNTTLHVTGAIAPHPVDSHPAGPDGIVVTSAQSLPVIAAGSSVPTSTQSLPVIAAGKSATGPAGNSVPTSGQYPATVPTPSGSFESAIHFLVDWLERQDWFGSIRAIGHRIVHGMDHREPQPITPELLDQLQKISPYDPEHLPGEIQLIRVFQQRHPTLTQIACFDTSFHASMPPVASLLPIPRRFNAMGIRRYGFHGLSYAYLLEELNRTAGPAAAQGKLILAHLGNGASLAAVKNGKSMDTSMGFTPSSGIPMGTRTGDLDPGVAWYLLEIEKLDPQQLSRLINHESGLLGISETSSDMRELLQYRDRDPRAAEAIDLFCYQAKKWIGAFATVLEGLDTLVFSGGIGENGPEIRAGICRGLGFLGIRLDAAKNAANDPIISTNESQVSVRVIRTNEQLMIARLVATHLQSSTTK